MSFPFDGSVSHLHFQQSQWEFSLCHHYVAAITFSFSINLHLLQFPSILCETEESQVAN